MSFKSLLSPKKYFIAIILLPCFFPLQPVFATALEQTELRFKMVELTPGTRLITNKSPERDPFNWPTTQRIRLRQIAEAEEDIFADFSLQGIVWNRSTPQAIINRQLVTIGDMVDGALVTNITQTKVSLTKNTKKHSMQFDTLDIDFGNQSHAKGKR
ncbi:MAG: hypothetical protein KKG53_07090 [Proteobacteria bacterium]|nr:hypothetical protein [Pseudomonadota bacterium]